MDNSGNVQGYVQYGLGGGIGPGGYYAGPTSGVFVNGGTSSFGGPFGASSRSVGPVSVEKFAGPNEKNGVIAGVGVTAGVGQGSVNFTGGTNTLLTLSFSSDVAASIIPPPLNAPLAAMAVVGCHGG